MAADSMIQTGIDTSDARYRRAELALWTRYGLEPTERFVDTRDPRCRLRIVEVGSGRPIVFIPGTFVAGPAWGALVRELRQDFRCILVDRPGHGLSTPIRYPSGRYGATTAAVVRGVFDALELETAAVVGSSIGNVWALRAALDMPRRVNAVALLGSGPIVDDVTPPAFIRLPASPIGSLIVRLPFSVGRARSMVRDSGHRASIDAGRVPDELFEWLAAFQRETGAVRWERAMVRTLVGRHGWRPGLTFDDGELAAVEAPLAWIVGRDDPIGSLDLWTGAATRMRRAQVTILDGAGHLPWLDDPAAVAAGIRRVVETPHR
jgi:2-hydroxy-6-oxonona-2,4-dienedioate hydrolase